MRESTANPELLKVIYGEICTAHHGIADFRAKLLALLPIASSTGIFLLLQDSTASHGSPLTAAIGLIGFLLTVGLFLYELRGIHRCEALSYCAAELEDNFLGPYRQHGPFSGEPPGILIATNTWAALVIYPTMAAAWVFVVTVGLYEGDSQRWVSLAICVLFGIILAKFGH